jgi:hypothetical protein
MPARRQTAAGGVVQDVAMDATDALNEIAFWLERESAPSFKVQAFRKAAAVIAGPEPGRAGRTHRQWTAEADQGIGERTFEVIREAVEGGTPAIWRACANVAPGRSPRAARTSPPPCAATCTATANGPTADRPSR